MWLFVGHSIYMCLREIVISITNVSQSKHCRCTENLLEIVMLLCKLTKKSIEVIVCFK